MVRVTFNYLGAKSSGSMPEVLVNASILQATEHIKRKVAGVRCRYHDDIATVVASSRDMKNISYEIESCCDDMEQKITNALQ